MARSKTAPSPAAAAAASPARKSAGLKAPPKQAAKKPTGAAVVITLDRSGGGRKIKREKKAEAPAEAAAAPASPAAAADVQKPKAKRAKMTPKARRRALIRRDQHEALAQSGRFSQERTAVELRPLQWKELATTLHESFREKDKPRIATKAATLQAHMGLQWASERLSDANTRKLGEFVRHAAPLRPADDEDMKDYAAKLATYDAANLAYADARIGKRIQARHMDASVRDALFAQGGISAIERFEDMLEHVEVLDRAKAEKDAIRAKEQHAKEQRDAIINGFNEMNKNKVALSSANVLQYRSALVEMYQAELQKQSNLVAKYERIIANAKADRQEIEGEGTKRAAAKISELGKVSIPDTEQAIAEAKEAIKDADLAYGSFREEHAVAIFAIAIQDRSKEQHALLKELKTKESAKKAARKTLHDLEQKLARYQAKLKVLQTKLPLRAAMVAEVDDRIAANQAKLEQAQAAEAEAAKLLAKSKAQRKQAIKAAAESSSDDDESGSQMDDSDD